MMRFQWGTAGRWRAWFTAGGLPWLSVVLLAAGVAWWLFQPHTQDTARRIGLLYEVVGIIVVFVEISRASGRHSLDPLHVRFVRYWRAVPLLAPSPIELRGSASASAVSCSALGQVGTISASSPTIEQRLALLEGKAAALESQHNVLRDRLSQEEAARAAAVQTEAAERRAGDAVLEGRIKEVETGGLDLSLFGVLWLLIGVVMTTGTPELCRWVLPGCR